MRPTIRVALVMFFGILLHFSAGNAAITTRESASTVVSSCAAVSLSVEHQTLVSATKTDASRSDATRECQTKGCSGQTCHCLCHGVVAAMPDLTPDMPKFSNSIGKPLAARYFVAITLPPPARPPRA